MRPLYLFLDFDGVLRSDGVDWQHFEHAAQLGELLVSYPEVQVIVSSSWRHELPLDELRERCGPILGERLVDVTPHIARRNVVDDDYLHSRFMGIATRLDGHHASPAGLNKRGAALARDYRILVSAKLPAASQCRGRREHARSAFRIGRSRVVVNPRGYARNRHEVNQVRWLQFESVAFDATCVVEVGA